MTKRSVWHCQWSSPPRRRPKDSGSFLLRRRVYSVMGYLEAKVSDGPSKMDIALPGANGRVVGAGKDMVTMEQAIGT